MRKKDPSAYQMITRHIRQELTGMLEKLSTKELIDSQKEVLLRRVWVLRGVLDYNLNMSKLEAIAEKYEKLAILPQGYFYPELYEEDSSNGSIC